MYSVIFNPIAQKEYQQAAIWYQEQQYGLGDKFQNCVDEAISLVLDKPLLLPIVKRRYREIPVAVFPYTVVYSINSKNKTLYISAVFHNSRNPRLKFRKPE